MPTEHPFVLFSDSCNADKTFVARAMGVPDIVSLVAVELEIPDLASLSGVCICYSSVARRELRCRVYNVLKRHISAWHKNLKCNLSFPIVDRIVAFLRMLYKHRSVVSGLTALSVLLSHSTKYYGPWIEDADMDVVTPNKEAAQVLLYLTDVEGYSLEPETMRRLDRSTGWDRHMDYWRRRTTVQSATSLIRKSDGKRIYVIESVSSTALSPISQVTNTMSCNWLDLHGVSSAYPRYTMRGYGTHNPGFRADNVFMTRQNLLLPLSGFSLRDFNHETSHCRKAYSYCPRRSRISEDSLTFSMALWPASDRGAESQLDHHRTVTHLPRVMWVWGDWDNHASHNQPYVPSRYSILEPMYEGQFGHP